MRNHMLLIMVVLVTLTGCERESRDSSATSNGGAAASSAPADSQQGMVVEFQQLLVAPDQFVTPQEARDVRELVDRKMQQGRIKTLAGMFTSPGAWQEQPWLNVAAVHFLFRIVDQAALLDDRDVAQCVVALAAQRGRPAVRRAAAVAMAQRDAGRAKAILLEEYGRVSVQLGSEGAEPTIAPVLTRLGVVVPGELTALPEARVLLAKAGVDVNGVDDKHLSAAAGAYNRRLHDLAANEQFEDLQALTQEGRAAGLLAAMYKDELQNPSTKPTEPEHWLE